MKSPCVYILAGGRNETIYVGVTSHLPRRLWEHENDVVPGFTNRYGIHSLVWYEPHPTMESAILREKRIKKWNRAWKVRLIEERNPYWENLKVEIY
jgi:putative endonuclease